MSLTAIMGRLVLGLESANLKYFDLQFMCAKLRFALL